MLKYVVVFLFLVFTQSGISQQVGIFDEYHTFNYEYQNFTIADQNDDLFGTHPFQNGFVKINDSLIYAFLPGGGIKLWHIDLEFLSGGNLIYFNLNQKKGYFVGGFDKKHAEKIRAKPVHISDKLYTTASGAGYYINQAGDSIPHFGGVIFYDFNTQQFELTRQNTDSTIGYNPWFTPKLYNNQLYYCNKSGGDFGSGSLVRFDLVSGTYQKLMDFSTPDGGSPTGSFTEDDSGWWYFVCEKGGDNNLGSICRYSPVTNTLQKVYDFDFAANSPYPELFYHDNQVYGTTEKGGLNNRGSMFSISSINHNYLSHIEFGAILSVDSIIPVSWAQKVNDSLVMGFLKSQKYIPQTPFNGDTAFNPIHVYYYNLNTQQYTLYKFEDYLHKNRHYSKQFHPINTGILVDDSFYILNRAIVNSTTNYGEICKVELFGELEVVGSLEWNEHFFFSDDIISATEEHVVLQVYNSVKHQSELVVFDMKNNYSKKTHCPHYYYQYSKISKPIYVKSKDALVYMHHTVYDNPLLHSDIFIYNFQSNTVDTIPLGNGVTAVENYDAALTDNNEVTFFKVISGAIQRVVVSLDNNTVEIINGDVLPNGSKIHFYQNKYYYRRPLNTFFVAQYDEASNLWAYDTLFYFPPSGDTTYLLGVNPVFWQNKLYLFAVRNIQNNFDSRWLLVVDIHTKAIEQYLFDPSINIGAHSAYNNQLFVFDKNTKEVLKVSIVSGALDYECISCTFPFTNTLWMGQPKFIYVIENNPLSINEVVSIPRENLLIYPNPSTGQAFIQVPDELVGGQLRIFDLQGKLIQEFVVNQSQLDATLANSGFYFIHITHEDKRATGKLVISVR
jgi:hypothetical protein